MHSANEKNSLRRQRTVVSLFCAAFLIAGCSKRGNTVASGNGQKGGFGVDGAATLRYLNTLDFTIASVGDSVLVQKYPCTTPGNTCPPEGVRLMFIPEAGAYKRDWQKAMTKDNEGYVVAAVLNVDDTAFTDLGLEPGKLAYAWVGQTGGTSADRGFAVYRIDTSTGLKQATWSETSNVSHCDNSAYRDKPSVKAKHPGSETCTPITVAQSIFGPRVAYAATARSAVQFGLQGLWISCSQGCCEVGAD
ncbi:MAG: hypothetical protein ABR582_07145 [Gemmatimonadaceae bacterium]